MGEEEEEEVLPTCNDDASSNNELTSATQAEETVIKTEPTAPLLADNAVPMEDVDNKDKEEEVAAVKVELKEDTDANDNNLDSKEENDASKETVKTEEEMETETTETGEEEPAAEEEGEESEDKLKHSDSLLEDKEEKESLAVPVVPAKVVITSSDSDILCKIASVIVSVMMQGQRRTSV